MITCQSKRILNVQKINQNQKIIFFLLNFRSSFLPTSFFLLSFLSPSSSHVFLTHTHPRLFSFFSIFLFSLFFFMRTQHLFIFRLLFFDYLSNFFRSVVIFVVSLFSSFFSDEWNEKI